MIGIEDKIVAILSGIIMIVTILWLSSDKDINNIL